ncbi:MAG: hypothetical protein ABIJ96_01605 [Elusimicrobiota bacterium]
MMGFKRLFPLLGRLFDGFGREVRIGKPGGDGAEGSALVQNSVQASLGASAYYEVWGGLESANRALWAALWFAVTVALLAMLLVRVQAGRPPVVIRVTDSGRAEVVANSGMQPPVSEVEIKNFLALFEKFFVELNVYTYDADLRSAFGMMSRSFQDKADRMLKSEGLIQALKTEQRRTRLVLTELRVERETPEHLECRIKGYREIGSYIPDKAGREEVFEHEIILKKTPRSEKAPYGVLVENFKESLFKR